MKKPRAFWEDLKKTRFGKSRFFALLVAGVLGILGISYLNKDLHPVLFGASNVFLTVAAFEITILLLDFVPVLGRRRKFRKMFYGPNLPSPIKIVFPEFIPDMDVFPHNVQRLLESRIAETTTKAVIPLPRTGMFMLSKEARLPFIRSQKVRERPNSNLRDASFILTEVAALQDLKALGNIASLIGEMSQEPPEIVTDTNIIERQKINGRNGNLIIIGMFSNYFTHSSTRREAKEFVELCFAEHYGACLELKNPDWDCPDINPENSETRKYVEGTVEDYGLILKFHPKEFRDKTWIIIGGVGADGTEGVSRYLAERWEELYGILDKNHTPIGDREFAAVLRVPKNPEDQIVVDRCIVKPR